MNAFASDSTRAPKRESRQAQNSVLDICFERPTGPDAQMVRFAIALRNRWSRLESEISSVDETPAGDRAVDSLVAHHSAEMDRFAGAILRAQVTSKAGFRAQALAVHWLHDGGSKLDRHHPSADDGFAGAAGALIRGLLLAD